ncbi:MAG: BON domain-containing protein [Novosphingobium sp.]
MNRDERNPENRQAGGYRDQDSSWDMPRQAGQWQDEGSRQAGGMDDTAEASRSAYVPRRGAGRARDLDSRYEGGPASSRYEEAPRGTFGPDPRLEGRYGYSRNENIRRASSSRRNDYPVHNFDASGGNDYSSFTSEDYGGRDFSADRGALSGGAHPSNSYRPSWGPGSWSSRDHDDDYGAWRAEGEKRGFLARAGDEVASWFGDKDASRRRDMDHRGRGPSDYTRSDERIREDVNDTLTQDWRLDASHVRVVVKEAEVTLDGTVFARQDKRRAEDLAENVWGVSHVQNNLRVTGSTARQDQPIGDGVSPTTSSASRPTTAS